VTAIPNEAAVGREGRVVVIGSVNIDTVLSLDVLPLPGETRIAHDMREHLGGKGQSQALAAARFGSSCALIAAVGKDHGGDQARRGLPASHVDISLVRLSAKPTGRAVVSVEAHGENSIVVSPGANAELRSLRPLDRVAVAEADVLLTQLEAGVEIAFEAITLAHEAGVTVILNAAPAAHVPVEVLDCVDYLIVNQVECLQLGGGAAVDDSARALALHARTVVVTLGGEGGRIYRGAEEPLVLPALDIEAVDTTGAGDTFCGAFAAGIAQQLPLAETFQLALIAGSLAALTHGNAPSIPDRSAVIAEYRLLEKHGARFQESP
jgi:ribokinase